MEIKRTKRMKEYLTPIGVVSAPRTGSTLIWQCVFTMIAGTCRFYNDSSGNPDMKFFNHITGGKWGIPDLLHGHKNNWLDVNEGKFELTWLTPTGEEVSETCWWDIVITERNFIDSYLSLIRVGLNNNDTFLKLINKEETLLSRVDEYRDQLQYIEYLKAEYKGRILTLQYEKFANNYDYIFEKFQSFFIRDTFPWKLVLNDKIKNLMIEGTKRERNIKVQETVEKDFGGNTSGLHKRHIWSNKINYSKDILTEKNYNRLLEEFAPEKIIPARNVTDEYLQNVEDRGGKEIVTVNE
tara:strand:- start:289 stop:1176 length:888 start_codon:yes stop_codon:yes gene_type:complete